CPAAPLTVCRGPLPRFRYPVPFAYHAAFEQPPPLRGNRPGLTEILLVHCLGKPGIGRLEDIWIHESHPAPCGARRLKSGISQLIKEVARNLSKITASPLLSG